MVTVWHKGWQWMEMPPGTAARLWWLHCSPSPGALLMCCCHRAAPWATSSLLQNASFPPYFSALSYCIGLNFFPILCHRLSLHWRCPRAVSCGPGAPLVDTGQALLPKGWGWAIWRACPLAVWSRWKWNEWLNKCRGHCTPSLQQYFQSTETSYFRFDICYQLRLKVLIQADCWG